MNYITKDSGIRQEFSSGMQRDTEVGKPRFDLIYTPLLIDWANLMSRGAEKYTERNWEKADNLDSLNRFKSSAWRHFVQFMDGETDEAHHAAILFNIGGCMHVMNKLNCDIKGNQWVTISKAPDYEVSQFGIVRRIKDHKIMSPWKNRFGYSLVSLSGNSRKHFQVHRLVMEAFIGDSDLQVNHIDGIKSNNNLSNLEYCTASENQKHAFNIGLKKASVSNAKISYDIAEKIRLRVDNGEKQKLLAKEFNISPQTVNDIVKSRIWRQ
jgi:hypothetical protein